LSAGAVESPANFDVESNFFSKIKYDVPIATIKAPPDILFRSARIIETTKKTHISVTSSIFIAGNNVNELIAKQDITQVPTSSLFAFKKLIP
jgi:hypothetical protein